MAEPGWYPSHYLCQPGNYYGGGVAWLDALPSMQPESLRPLRCLATFTTGGLMTHDTINGAEDGAGTFKPPVDAPEGLQEALLRLCLD